MSRKHEFDVRLGPYSNPAEAVKVALALRFLYAGEHVRYYGTRLMRENYDRDPMCWYEDQLGLECKFPTLLLRERSSFKPIRLVFIQPEDHDPALIDRTLNKFYQIIESTDDIIS